MPIMRYIAAATAIKDTGQDTRPPGAHLPDDQLPPLTRRWPRLRAEAEAPADVEPAQAAAVPGPRSRTATSSAAAAR